MRKSKYLNKTIDGKWLVKSYSYRNSHYYYTLTNIFNDKSIEVTHATLLNILEGKTSVSKIMSTRIIKSGQSRFVSYASKRLSGRIYK